MHGRSRVKKPGVHKTRIHLVILDETKWIVSRNVDRPRINRLLPTKGLTLISSTEEILLGIVAERLAKVYSLKTSLDGKCTFGMFIEFKKSYNRAQHGALHCSGYLSTGVRGKTLHHLHKWHTKRMHSR